MSHKSSKAQKRTKIPVDRYKNFQFKTIGSPFLSGLPVFGPILIIISLCLSLGYPKDQFQLAKKKLVKDPNNLEARLVLAEELLANNQIHEAEKELVKVPGSENTEKQNTQILEEEANIKLKWLRDKIKASDPKEIIRLINEWEEIVVKKPDYRDGYLQLALLYYQTNQIQKARQSLETAFAIDPNYQITQMLSSTIGH